MVAGKVRVRGDTAGGVNTMRGQTTVMDRYIFQQWLGGGEAYPGKGDERGQEERRKGKGTD